MRYSWEWGGGQARNFLGIIIRSVCAKIIPNKGILSAVRTLAKNKRHSLHKTARSLGEL